MKAAEFEPRFVAKPNQPQADVTKRAPPLRVSIDARLRPIAAARDRPVPAQAAAVECRTSERIDDRLRQLT
jgi:hypothetical protein